MSIIEHPFITVYKAFLLSPQELHLSSKPKLTYVTTCSTLEGVNAILENHKLNNRHLKKTENIISAHISFDSLVLETVTTIDFRNGVGSYVPTLDQNFVVDHSVVVPIVSNPEDIKNNSSFC